MYKYVQLCGPTLAKTKTLILFVADFIAILLPFYSLCDLLLFMQDYAGFLINTSLWARLGLYVINSNLNCLLSLFPTLCTYTLAPWNTNCAISQGSYCGQLCIHSNNYMLIRLGHQCMLSFYYYTAGAGLQKAGDLGVIFSRVNITFRYFLHYKSDVQKLCGLPSMVFHSITTKPKLFVIGANIQTHWEIQRLPTGVWGMCKIGQFTV